MVSKKQSTDSAPDCTHPAGKLKNVRPTEFGTIMDGRNVSLQADCACGAAVVLDCRIQDVIEV